MAVLLLLLVCLPHFVIIACTLSGRVRKLKKKTTNKTLVQCAKKKKTFRIIRMPSRALNIYIYTTTTTWINIDGYLFTTGNIKLSAGQCLGPDDCTWWKLLDYNVLPSPSNDSINSTVKKKMMKMSSFFISRSTLSSPFSCCLRTNVIEGVSYFRRHERNFLIFLLWGHTRGFGHKNERRVKEKMRMWQLLRRLMTILPLCGDDTKSFPRNKKGKFG